MRKKSGRRTALLVSLAALGSLTAFAWVKLPGWYAFWRDFESIGKNDQGYREYRHQETGIVFVRVPGGSFLMGSPEDEGDRRQDEKQRKVVVSPFLIAKYEVTQAQWQNVMGENLSRFKGDDLPVEEVSWEECRGFCEKTGLVLPSEEQWEYACRAGATSEYAGTGELDDMGWYKDNSGKQTHPVGQKQANDFGLYDMHGNVLEWCEDVYEPGSEYRVVRGGSSRAPARDCRSASRIPAGPSRSRLSFVGFRVVRPLP